MIPLPPSQVERKHRLATEQKYQDRRFTAAVAAMQGLLAVNGDGWSLSATIEEAVTTADLLLERLAK